MSDDKKKKRNETPEEALARLRIRYDSVVDGAMQMTVINERLRVKVQQLTNQVTRLSGELQSKQTEVQLLGTDFNRRVSDVQAEVVHLRKKMVARGMNPDG